MSCRLLCLVIESLTDCTLILPVSADYNSVLRLLVSFIVCEHAYISLIQSFRSFRFQIFVLTSSKYSASNRCCRLDAALVVVVFIPKRPSANIKVDLFGV